LGSDTQLPAVRENRRLSRAEGMNLASLHPVKPPNRYIGFRFGRCVFVCHCD
jgi:hypothetical protein